MRSLITVFLTTTALFAATGLPIAYEAHPTEFIVRAPSYAAAISAAEARIRVGDTTIRFHAGRATPQLQPGPILPAHVNYIFRSTRATYQLHSSVRWHNAYPGVDLVFRDNPDRFEYDIELAPGANLSPVALAFDGVDNIRIDHATGDLILTAARHEIREPKPVAYQLIAGSKQLVDVSYGLDPAQRIHFHAAAYNPKLALIIDPQLVFEHVIASTAGASDATAIALDSQGNIYTAGHTLDPNFPHTGSSTFHGLGQFDSYVAKWTPDGSQLLYATFIGGTGNELTSALAVDSSGIAYIAGNTTSSDFPVTPNAAQKSRAGFQNAFFAKLSTDGSQLLYATYLGGGTEQAQRLAIDNTGSAVLVGYTNSGFPVTSGAIQSAPAKGCTKNFFYFNISVSGAAFIARFAADGSLAFSTLLGGACFSQANDVVIDPAGNAWVAGETNSDDFPVTSGALQSQYGGYVSDGFLARFDPAGHLAYSTFLGGTLFDEIHGIALDHSGNIYLTGISDGFQQPASTGAFQSKPSYGCLILGIGPPVFTPQGNAFVMKLDPAATNVLGLTYLGAPCSLTAFSIAVDSTGAPWIASTIFNGAQPTANPIQQQIGSGLIGKFSPDLTQLLFSTYFDQPRQIALDNFGFAYVAGNAQPLVNTLPQQAYFAKIDGSVPAISLDAVAAVNAPPAAVGQNNGISAGEVLRIAGKRMGPTTPTPGIVANNAVTTSIAGVQVTFDGTPAPLLSVSSSEILCVAPFALAGRHSTSVQVKYNGAQSNAALANVIPAALEVLGVFNEDFTPNSASNPAAAGSNMTIYLSGAGNTNPPAQDGQVNGLPPAAPATAVTLRFIDDIYTVTFAGAAPGLVAGILQVNFIAPQASASNVNVNASGGLTYFPVYVK